MWSTQIPMFFYYFMKSFHRIVMLINCTVLLVTSAGFVHSCRNKLSGSASPEVQSRLSHLAGHLLQHSIPHSSCHNFWRLPKNEHRKHSALSVMDVLRHLFSLQTPHMTVITDDESDFCTSDHFFPPLEPNFSWSALRQSSRCLEKWVLKVCLCTF